MLFGIAIIIYVIVCLFLVLLVIIQSDKGGGISGAIGGGLSGANTFLGTQDTANILTRLTTGFAIGYMALCIILSLALSRTSTQAQKSELQKRAESRKKFSPSSALGGALPLKESAETRLPPGEAQQQQQGGLQNKGVQPIEQQQVPIEKERERTEKQQE